MAIMTPPLVALRIYVTACGRDEAEATMRDGPIPVMSRDTDEVVDLTLTPRNERMGLADELISLGDLKRDLISVRACARARRRTPAFACAAPRRSAAET